MQEFSTVQRYNALHIFSSLRADEIPSTATTLYQNATRWGTGEDVQVFHHAVTTADEIRSIMRSITEQCSLGLCPILYFDMNGSSEGLELSNCFMTWGEFVGLCRQVNVATGNRLLIVMAVCTSLDIQHSIGSGEYPLCYGLVCAKGEVHPIEIAGAMTTFLRSLFLPDGDSADFAASMASLVAGTRCGYGAELLGLCL